MTKVYVNQVGISNDIQETLKNRVVHIVENFLATNDLFESLDRDEMVVVMVEAFLRNYNEEQLQKMSNNDLTIKVRKILGLETLSHVLDDLTPKQIAEYETAVQEIRKSS